ncbi:unnamed protein product, partial [Allacma fusca]
RKKLAVWIENNFLNSNLDALNPSHGESISQLCTDFFHEIELVVQNLFVANRDFT